jgi:hypothetical protein
MLSPTSGPGSRPATSTPTPSWPEAAQVDACHRLDVAHLTERAGLAELDVRRLEEALTWERQERRRAWTRGLVTGVGLGVVGASVGYLVVR